MPKSKKFVESSDESSDSEPKSKKKVPKKSKKDSSDEEATQSKKPKKDKKKEEDDNVWDLGNNRQVTVREFKGKLLIDIREMYFDKDGELRPGKKGISLNMAQWRKFVDAVADVDEAVKSKC